MILDASSRAHVVEQEGDGAALGRGIHGFEKRLGHGNVANDVPEEFTQNPEINKAVGLLRESSYSDAQILGYEKFWDIVRVEYAVKYDSIKEGKELGFQQGLQQGIEKGMLQGIEKGRKAQALEIARNMKSLHISVADIAKATGLTADEIELA